MSFVLNDWKLCTASDPMTSSTNSSAPFRHNSEPSIIIITEKQLSADDAGRARRKRHIADENEVITQKHLRKQRCKALEITVSFKGQSVSQRRRVLQAVGVRRARHARSLKLRTVQLAASSQLNVHVFSSQRSAEILVYIML